MTDDDAIRLTRAHLERQFPKTCAACGSTFGSLADYLRRTTHLGEPASYDADAGDLRPRHPLGTMALANCGCGNTLALSSDGMKLLTLWRLMRWAHGETKRREISWRRLLSWLRAEVDRRVLAESPTALRS